MRKHSIIRFFLVIASLYIQIGNTADYGLGVQPDAPFIDIPDFYEGLARDLSENIGVEIEFVRTKDWASFHTTILNNGFDILLAQPHIIAWAMETESNGGINHLPIAMISGNLNYEVIVPEKSNVQTINDLKGRRVCAKNSPNLSSVIFQHLLPELVNPAIMKNLALKEGEYQTSSCDAVIIQDKERQYLNANFQGRTVSQLPEFPGWGMSAFSTRPVHFREALTEYMVNGESSSTKDKLKQHLNSAEGEFKTFDSERQWQSYNILPGVVWDW